MLGVSEPNNSPQLSDHLTIDMDPVWCPSWTKFKSYFFEYWIETIFHSFISSKSDNRINVTPYWNSKKIWLTGGYFWHKNPNLIHLAKGYSFRSPCIETGSHPSDPLKFSFYLGHSVFSSISGISAPAFILLNPRTPIW